MIRKSLQFSLKLFLMALFVLLAIAVAKASTDQPAPQLIIKPIQLVSVTLYPGSLKTNIERVAHEYGWSKVVWDLPNDYRWTGTTVLKARSLQSLLESLLKDYPLQAVFYRGNHVLVMQPRTLQ